MKTPEFDIKRALLVLRNQVEGNLKSHLLGAGVIFAIYVVLYLLTARFGGVTGWTSGGYAALLVIVSVVAAGGAFTVLHREREAVTWLMLPASTLEKFVVTILVSTIILVINLTMVVFLADLFSLGMTLILGLPHARLLNPFSSVNLQAILGVLMMQPLFLFASLRFAKHPVFKILLASLVFLLVIAGLAVLVFWLVWMKGQSSFSIDSGTLRMMNLPGWMQDLGRTLRLDIVAGVAFPAFFLVLSWLKLRESEVKDGIR